MFFKSVAGQQEDHQSGPAGQGSLQESLAARAWRGRLSALSASVCVSVSEVGCLFHLHQSVSLSVR